MKRSSWTSPAVSVRNTDRHPPKSRAHKVLPESVVAPRKLKATAVVEAAKAAHEKQPVKAAKAIRAKSRLPIVPPVATPAAANDTRPGPVVVPAPAARVHFAGYAARLARTLETFDWSPVEELAQDLLACWRSGRQVFLCGNGGSAGNANHLANDFTFSLSRRKGSGLRVHALSENPAVLTCLANDVGYDNVFAYQLAVTARKGDVLVVLSGSGNSPNILRALEEARDLGMKSYAVLGFDGGRAKGIADVPVHFAVDDMQIAEDTQTMVGHMIVQWLYAQRDEVASRAAPRTSSPAVAPKPRPSRGRVAG